MFSSSACSPAPGGDGSPDFLFYHRYIGYVEVTDGRPQDIAPAGMQGYFYPGLDALYFGCSAISQHYPCDADKILAHYQLRRETPCADITSNVDASTACQLQRAP
jgi:hypothetical protein